jgi:transposase
MESGLNHQYIRDLLKENNYDVNVARPLMVKAIAYARVKTDTVDARTLADLLRAKMIPEAYIPDKEIRDLRDLVRRRYRFVDVRTMFKNRIRAELAKRWINFSDDYQGKLFTEQGRKYLHSLHIDAIDDYLEEVEHIDAKIKDLDWKVRTTAENDRYAKLLLTIPGISYYGALLISCEIADIERFPDYTHLCSYARLVPSTHQSGETNYSHSDKKGSSFLNWIMIQCTRSDVRNCDSAITRHYNEVKKRRDENIAIVAAARKLMRAINIMLKEEQPLSLDG